MKELLKNWVRFFGILLAISVSTHLRAQADFTASTNSGCFPLTVNFNATSTPAATAWSWDFGNASSSTQQNPSAVYSSAGVYTVRCTMTVSGNAQIVVKTGFIRVFSPPTANFVTNTTTGCSPLAVTFSSTSTVGSAPINSYLWDFGNGVTSTQQNPQFTYAAANTYNISLVVTDTNGCSHTRTRNGLISVDPKPNAEFASSNNNGCNFPHTVNFTNLTTANAPGIVTYNWSFGDGNTTTAVSPNNTYNNPGLYNVTLVATNSIGCRDTMRKNNFANIANLDANFSSDVQVGCPPLRVNFNNSSSPNSAGTTYIWDFGNNQSSRAKDTGIIYINPGQYTVKLLMIAPNGCRDSLVRSQYINALPRPSARINVDDSAACRPPLRGQFTSNAAASYLWRFGDGTTSTQQNPLKTYNDTGLYTVSLRVTGTN
jgi:PKD repeat protein